MLNFLKKFLKFLKKLFFLEKKKKETAEKTKATILPKEETARKSIKAGTKPVLWVLKSPHIAEKPTYLAKQNQYVFRVFPDANKTEIKKAIEKTYDVEVVKIGTIKVQPKKRRLGRISGWRKGYKKAIVALKKGQSIEILPK